MSVTTHQSNSANASRLRKACAALGTLVATLTVGVAIGPLAILVAVAISGALILASTTAAFALGQVVLVALVPPDGAPIILILAEVGLLVVLFSTAIDYHDSGRLLVASLLAGLAVGATGWLLFWMNRTVWIAASAIVVTTAFLTYGIHRYEQVTLGLVKS